MAAPLKSSTHLETAHVLFIDVVGYSKLLVGEQRELVQQLNQVVRQTSQFRKSDAAGKLIAIPAGDGMALVFFQSPEEPAQCAIEISEMLRDHPHIRLRMGIHSGPVDQVKDVNDRINVAGIGINMAQRVMACGDAGHILLTKRVAEDLAQDSHWQPYLHDLGEAELKHGARIGIVNLYTEEFGNPKEPEKLRQARETQRASATPASDAKPAGRTRAVTTALIIAALAAVAAGSYIFSHRYGSKTLSPSAVPARPAISEKSIAVLPFENLTADPENAFFADGVQDEILTDLAKIADLKVISRTSVMQYKTGTTRNLREIAQALGVAHVVEGSVQRIGNHVRMRAQLIDARTDTHLWAEQYDRDLADVFAIQSEIAKAIADQLQAKISPNEKAAIEKAPTTDLTAYDLYLRAQVLWGDVSDPIHAREKLPQAARLLDEAVARDPHFLLAWCLLAKTHGAIYSQGYDHTRARLDLANAAVQSALRLQPDAGEAHLALANYYYQGFRDYGRARSELAIAGRTLPNDSEVFVYTGFIDRREGHWEEATRNLERALELDPRNLFILEQLALTYSFQHRYADETRTWARALTIVPGDPLSRISTALVAFNWRADITLYQTTLATVIAENPGVAPDVDSPLMALCERTAAAADRALTNYPRDGVVDIGVVYPHAYWEGIIARWQGDSTRAQAAFTAARSEVEGNVRKQPDFAPALSLLGMIDAALGRKKEALSEGRHACELLPISKDGVDGVALAVNLAQIYAWLGEKDLAIEQIATVERSPNELSYGLLKLHPYWDSLRGDPRFEKIVSSLAPKS